ncbi:MAG: hypothetical protein RL660_228 [Bacteroidota bacterium]|jgi:hypothetical protein
MSKLRTAINLLTSTDIKTDAAFTMCDFMRTLASLIIMCIVTSCSYSAKNQHDIKSSKGRQAKIDTTSQKELVLAKSKMNCSLLIYTDTNSDLSIDIDTLELIDLRFACDCASWFDSASYAKETHSSSRLTHLDYNTKVFRKHVYYLEAASKELDLSSLLLKAHTKVVFYGRKYNKETLPNDNQLQDPNPPAGKVFRYYGYEIIRPFRVYAKQSFSDSTIVESEVDHEVQMLTIE